ncbi:sugar transferase [Bosea lathyri]|uniref:Sugar transferase involved in LPS biosynthesis (Colanic, teichoic acid) n=1 Tax=Bosea lathyri TaxID=1036778 RepID=A0A1H5YRE3_9HYPH|nr:sugar transferase [Bosea lathyri]SEG26739.1 Sugar transferase involved in LPS biosynthesis (colanic, teichoic acid) [Bosea lathyri]
MAKMVMSPDFALRSSSDERSTSSSGKVFKYAIKQIFDLAASATALFLLAPLLVGIALLVRGRDGGPAFFRQTRIGKDGRPFKCLKFRSMVLDADGALQDHLARDPVAMREWQDNQKLTVDPRITPIGAVLRKTSLDELPQLINILKGEMSFVGPRPIVPDEIHRYGETFSHCFSVVPGLTGLWQVSGRSDCSYARRVALDSRYASDWTLLGDVEILLRTVPAVLQQHGSR